MKRTRFRSRVGSIILLGACLVLFVTGGTISLRAATFDLQSATISDINAAFDSGALTSEKLVQLCLARISTYEPKLHAVITLNPKALEEARALDAERKAKGPRSPLHGIPVIFKDNYDTADLQTSGGFFGLKGSIPPQDSTIVAKLRAAGAIILLKANLSEFASGAAMSSLGGQSHNPHNLAYSPSGSSGGTGVSIAAAYAPLGYGTDTGGSIRGPSTANGIVGLKPTQGLLSRAGIIPLVLSFDTGGPMARSVYDIAVSLNLTTGLDPRDDATKRAEGQVPPDYTKFLDKAALKGARIGVARDFFGQDGEVDSTMESALSAMRHAGATIIDVHYPDGVLKTRADVYATITRSEFKVQVGQYLATLKPGYPKTLEDMIALSEKVTSPTPEGYLPNPTRLTGYRTNEKGPPLTDPLYLATKNFGVPYIRESLIAVFVANKLDAIVYPTSPRRPTRISDFTPPPAGGAAAAGAGSATNLANITGFPDLIIPAGFTTDGLPIGISFFGRAFTEPKLLALGYAYEQATHALRQPVNTPSLPGESFTY